MFEIRAITGDDVDEAARMHLRSWQSGFAGVVPAEFLASLDAAGFAARRRAHQVPERGASLVATENGRIVGVAAFGPYRPKRQVTDVDAGELYSIYVDPGHWGRGVGHRLFGVARERLSAAGFPVMRLWVFEGNHRGRRFYERAGMRPDGAREFWTPGADSTLELPEIRYATDL